ncbi:ADP-ribosylglycohydrolase family protein [Yinghuangia sp. YIM S09857]|uniref:ADP-ribosylglycohydrolase family protein n=1 Tax=Yinghuangia sp. YIM S09857 TaxID=3436929 RepID=UPI003F5385F2
MGYDRVAGSMFGLAYGDALGAPTEFLSYAEIMRRHDVPGPRELPVRGGVALVTDDTQMALAVAQALADVLGTDTGRTGAPRDTTVADDSTDPADPADANESARRGAAHDAPNQGPAAAPRLDAARLTPRLRTHFLTWWASPDNNRAPGNTCLRACEALADGVAWSWATVRGSKGCGANMRVSPVALVDGVGEADRCGAAQLQAAMTHGHPTALAASDLTAAAVHALRTGVAPSALPAHLRAHAEAQRSVYHGDWLGDELWRGPFGTTPEAFIERGWDECLTVLDRLDAALVLADRRSDPCQVTGAGWIAEEAFATGLLCFLMYEDAPVDALARAAASSGDSDSIAALAGAFAGAAYGMAAWPAEWEPVIEYREDLVRLSGALAR